MPKTPNIASENKLPVTEGSIIKKAFLKLKNKLTIKYRTNRTGIINILQLVRADFISFDKSELIFIYLASFSVNGFLDTSYKYNILVVSSFKNLSKNLKFSS